MSYLSGINGNAMVDSEALGFELANNFRINLIHSIF
jgi:hypothetical protein